MRHGSLFSGIGGFDLASQWMGWENVFQVEWDKWCQKVLAKNFPDALRFGDIVEFNKMLENGEITTHSGCTAKQVTNKGTMGCKDAETERERGIGVLNSITHPSLRDGQIHIGHIDIITGGFPCQPFSHAGKRKGTDDSRYLWPEMLTTIRILKPSFVVGENVAGLVSMENGKTLDRILSDLANEGYQTEQFIIPACGVRAWHRRDRIWIIAHSLNGTDRTDRGQSRKTESIPELNRETGCAGEFSGTSGEIYPNSPTEGFPVSRHQSRESKISQKLRTKHLCEDVSDSEEQRIQRIRGIREQGTEENVKQGLPMRCSDRDRAGSDWWTVEPSVGRVANGIPNRVDRLKGLGNAVVPQVVYEIFKAIEQLNENILSLSQKYV